MAKYRERWEKLKESAKRKRAAKENAANITIPEEQEAEAEAEGSKSTSETPVVATAEQVPISPSGFSSHSVLRSPDSIVATR